MKKRLLAILLALGMVVTSITPVMAEEETTREQVETLDTQEDTIAVMEDAEVEEALPADTESDCEVEAPEVENTEETEVSEQVEDKEMELSASSDIAHGTFNTGVSWRLTAEGELIVSGKGSIPDYPGFDNYSEEIKKVTIEDGVTSIGEDAFFYCEKLTSVELPNSLTSIGGYAFSGCKKLKDITIPKSVTRIDDGAFFSCSSLTSIVIPNGVTDISRWDFMGCDSLVIYRELRDGTLELFGYNRLDRDYTIPSECNGVAITRIGEWAFEGCSSIYSVEIPDSIVSIGEYAFDDCSELMSVVIPNSVITMGDCVFQGCSSLSDVEIPDGIINIPWGAFSGCSSLTNVTIPTSVTTIEDYAFEDCSSLSKIILPQTITSCEDFVFSGCNNLVVYYVLEDGTLLLSEYHRSDSTFNIPSEVDGKKVTCIGNGAFFDNNDLTAVGIPNTITWIGENAFKDCVNLRSVVIPDSITWVSAHVFSGCLNLITATLPKTVTVIEDGAFEYCISLKSINIPNGVQYIGYDAFQCCESLTSLIIPSSMTYLVDTFYGCSNLKAITIPASVKQIDGNFDTCSKNLVISGYRGSEAYYVADANGIMFNDLGLACPVITVSNSTKGINISWEANPEAKGYYIYRKQGSGKWTKVYTYKHSTNIVDEWNLSWTDTTAIAGQTYIYTIKAYDGSGASRQHPDMNVTRLAPVTISSITSSSGGAKVTWNKAEGANGYYVYRRLENGSWTRIAKIKNGSTLSYVDKDIPQTAGVTYYYTVRSYNSVNGSVSPTNTTKYSYTNVGKCTVQSAANVSNGIKITWNQPAGAKGYTVYRADGSDKYVAIATIKNPNTLTYTDTKATTNGQKYTYAVRGYNGSVKGAYTGKVIYRLTTPAISSVSNSSSKAMTVKWNKNSKATGYQVRYISGSTDKKVTIKSNATLKTVIKSLAKGKTYKVYVRSYKTVSGVNYYSAWSPVKSLTIRK